MVVPAFHFYQQDCILCSSDGIVFKVIFLSPFISLMSWAPKNYWALKNKIIITAAVAAAITL